MQAPGGRALPLHVPFNSRGSGVRPSKCSGSRWVRTGVQVAVRERGDAAVSAVPEPAGPAPVTSPALGCASVPGPPPSSTAAQMGHSLRRNVPDPAAGPPPPGRGPGRPGTCGRRGAVAARLSDVRGAPSPAPAFPGRVSRLPPGRRGVGPAASRPPVPRTAPAVALTGLGRCPASAFPGGPWRFRTRESGRGVSQHRPENGRRRLGSAGPARPRRGVGDAAWPGRGLPGLSRGPDVGASTRPGPGLERTRRGRGGGTHHGPARPQTQPGCDWGRGGGNPRRPQTPGREQRPPPPSHRGRTQFRTCREGSRVRASTATEPSHYQNQAWVRRGGPGFCTQIPENIQPLHI